MKAVLGGAGWYTDDNLQLVRKAVDLSGGLGRVAVFPTPLTKADNSEIDGLPATLGREFKLRFLTRDTQAQPSAERAAKLIKWASVVLITGGNFTELMIRWQATGIDELIKAAATANNIVLVGSSAGANSAFEWGVTDTLPLGASDEEDQFFHPQDGLGLLTGGICPHHDGFHTESGVSRAERVKEIINDGPIGGSAIGVDHFAHLVLDTDAQTARVGRVHRYAGVSRYQQTESGLKVSRITPSDDNVWDKLFS